MTNNPYFTIWFETNSTIDRILRNEIPFNFRIPVLLTVLGGSISNLKDMYVVLEGIVPTLIAGMVFIIIGYLALLKLLPWLIKKTGQIWNGKSGIDELKIVIALAQIPALILLLEQLIFLGFGKLIPEIETNFVLQWIVWVFYMRIIIIGVAKVQGFNTMTAFLNLIIAVLPFFVLRMIFI